MAFKDIHSPVLSIVSVLTYRNVFVSLTAVRHQVVQVSRKPGPPAKPPDSRWCRVFFWEEVQSKDSSLRGRRAAGQESRESSQNRVKRRRSKMEKLSEVRRRGAVAVRLKDLIQSMLLDGQPSSSTANWENWFFMENQQAGLAGCRS